MSINNKGGGIITLLFHLIFWLFVAGFICYIGWVVVTGLYMVFRLPFVDDDASIDLGIIILKSSFVKFLIVSLMIGGIWLIMELISRRKNNSKTK